MSKPVDLSAGFKIADFDVHPQACRLVRGDDRVKLEPKVMELLVLLASDPGRVFSRAEIEASVWPDVTVGEDSVTRAAMKLRRAFGDTSENPKFIQTVSKRGYALIAALAPLHAEANASAARSSRAHLDSRPAALAGALALIVIIALAGFFAWRGGPEAIEDDLVARADAFYVQYTRENNEAAIILFERALLDDPNNAAAHSGLANALIQRVLRWPNAPGTPETESPGLSAALASDRPVSDRAEVERARRLAERATQLAPRSADALTALGLVQSVQGELAAARQSYQRAIVADTSAWRAHVNLGELALMDGDLDAALAAFEAAYGAAAETAERAPQRVGDWPLHIAMIVGAHYEAAGMPHLAANWYRQVLEDKPLHTGATLQLVRLLREAGETREADALCERLTTRVGVFEACRG